MPILEEAAAGSPLTQGDVLKGVDLFRTKLDPSGAVDKRSPSPYCMVLSRPCATLHKSDVLVAEIAKFSESVPKGVENFEQARQFLHSLRDGRGRPDRFYLGEIPGTEGRFVAKLDAIFTVMAEDKTALVAKRVFALNGDFKRDLHVRIFNSFASFGFDDVDWLTDGDLNLLLTHGQQELSKLQSELAAANLVKAKQSFAEKPHAEAPINNLREQIAKLEKSLAPYLNKQEERHGRA